MKNFLSFGTSENKATIIGAFLLFSVVAALVVLKAARDAFVLSQYSSRALPLFMLATTVAVAFMAAVYLRIYTRLRMSWAVGVLLAVFIAGTLLLWESFVAGARYSAPLFYVWVGIFSTLAPVQAWTVISRRCRTREAKRAIGLLGGGGIAGSIAGGFVAQSIASQWGVDSLLPTAVGFMLLALITSLTLSTKVTQEENTTEEVEPKATRRSFVMLISLVVVVATILTTFVDYQFKIFAQRELVDVRSLAVFFGHFYAYLGVATLIFQIAITPLLMKHFRVWINLCILPLALVLTNGLVLVVASWWTAVIMKGSEQLFKHSVDRSAFELVSMAIPDHAKVKLKSLIDTLSVQGSEGAAALILVGLFSIGNAQLLILSVTNILLGAIWIGASIFLGREHKQLLGETIERSTIDIERVKADLFSPDFVRFLRGLENSDEEVILDVLEILKDARNKKYFRLIKPLLKHNNRDVRLSALRLLFISPENFAGAVKRLLKNEDHQVRAEAAHYIAYRSTLPKALRHDKDLLIQAAVAAADLRKNGNRTKEKLLQLIEESRVTGMSEVRSEIAHVLEFSITSNDLSEVFSELIRDPEEEVRKAAFQAISRACPRHIIPELIQCLTEKSLRESVIKALACYGETILEELRKAVEGRNPIELKKAALQAAAAIGGEKSLGVIISAAKGSDLVLRFAAIKALNRMRKSGSLEQLNRFITSLLDMETEALQMDIECSRAFSPKPDGLMDSVLKQRQIWTRQRIFRLLGLLYEPESIYQTYLAFVSEDYRKADVALELLDTSLSPEHRQKILPLIEAHEDPMPRESNEEERKTALRRYLHEMDPLTVSAALADLSDWELQEWKSLIWEELATFPDIPIVHETLLWRYTEMEKHSETPKELTTIEKLEHLNKIDIFSKIGPHELLLLADESEEVEYQPDETIFSQDEIAHYIFCLVEGSVELSQPGIQRQVIRPGESFGTLVALTGQPRLSSARALERCICLRLRREAFWEILEEYPLITQGIFEVLVQRIRMLSEQQLAAVHD